MNSNPSLGPKKRSRAWKWTWRITIAFVFLLLGPYFLSRIAAPANRLHLLSSANAQLDANSDSIRIACYNIAHGRGLAKSNWDGGTPEQRIERLDQIAALLKEIDADIVILNEVDFDTSWSNHVNQAEYFAEKCGYPFRVEERNLDFRVLHRTWRFGNAILSRVPLTNASLIDLPSFSEFETAAAGKKRAFGVDTLIGDSTIHVVAAHLSHRSEKIREKSAAAIIDHVKAVELPTVIAGDMNSSPPPFPQHRLTKNGKNAIETFRSAGLFKFSQENTPTQKSEFTFPADSPAIVIDWFLFTKELDEKASYRTVDSTLSDHRPIVIDLSLKITPQSENAATQKSRNRP